MIEYRLANKQEIPKLLDFYHFMIDFVRNSDIKLLWKRDAHPSDLFISESVANGDALIGIDADTQEIACAAILNEDGAPGYEDIPWISDDAEGNAGVLHVLATHPEWRRHGLGTKMLECIADMAALRGYKSVRLDTLTYNTPAKNLYISCGFDYIGDYPVDYGDFGLSEVSVFERPTAVRRIERESALTDGSQPHCSQ